MALETSDAPVNQHSSREWGGPGFMSPPASPTTHPGLCGHSPLSPQDLRVPSDHSRVVFPCLQESPQRWHFSGSRLHELPHPEKSETDPRELESWFSKSTTLICSDWFSLGISQQNPSLYLRYYWLFKQMWKYKLIQVCKYNNRIVHWGEWLLSELGECSRTLWSSPFIQGLLLYLDWCHLFSC